MATPVRFTSGVTTFPAYHPVMGQYLAPNPFQAAAYEDDFFRYAAGDWTVTASTGTTALGAGNGGLIVQTTSSSSSDVQHNLKNPLSTAITAGNRAWFVWRGKVDTVANSTWLLGLTSALTAFVPSDGIYLSKAAAATTLTLNVRKSGTSTTQAMSSNLVLTDGGYVVCGFFYDGKPTPTIYAFAGNSSTFGPGESVSSYVSSIVSVTDMTNLPTANLGVSFGVQTNAAATRALTTDYVLGTTEITR